LAGLTDDDLPGIWARTNFVDCRTIFRHRVNGGDSY
jgi:hypothetical protein